MTTSRASTGHPSSSATAALERVRSRIRSVAVSERLLAGLAGVGAWLLGSGLIDYTLRLPGWLRLALLIAGGALLVITAWRSLVPALRLRPRLSTVALRLERSEFGRVRGLRGVLASGVALGAESAEDEPASIRVLRSKAAAEADARLEGTEPWKIVDTALLKRRGWWAGAVVAAACAIAVVAPSIAWTGLARQIAPFGDAAWPRRFAVADATGAGVHPLGTALPLRALVTKTNRSLGQTPVIVAYRVNDADGPGPIRREPMTPQRVTELSRAGEEGEAYERLVDLPVIASPDDEPARLEYAFETPDDRTDWAEITLVEQPEVTGIEVVITPPAYAATVGGAFLAGEVDLGEASRSGGLVGPVLAGSGVVITTHLNKPATPSVAEPLLEIESGAAPAGVSIEQDGASARIAWNADASARLSLGLRDRFGVESLEDTVVRFDVVADAKPRVAVVEPVRDESVLSTAVVDVEAEGRDDVALAWVGLAYERARVPGGSEGAQAESDGKRIDLARTETSAMLETLRTRLDLAPLGLRPGDVLEIYGLSADSYERDGVSHEVAESDPRRLRIISESELIDELLAELGGVRQAAIRLDQQQAELQDRLAGARERGESPNAEDARRQSNVSESLDAAAKSVERVADRLERNGLEDEGLRRVVRDASRAADRGARAAESAAESLNEAADNAEAAAEQPEGEASEQAEAAAQEAAERAEQESEEVRRALEELARALDRGEDSWAVRRALEGILQDQSELSRETVSAGAQTVGRSSDELTEEERSILDDIARRQLDVAERTAELLDELEERAEESAEQDAGQSSAMRAASRRGREQGVAQMLREASRAVAQNRAADAGRSQDEAQEQLEEMLNDLEQAERQRDAELQRALLSLVETLEALIRTQESELARLDAQDDGLAAGMERLHRNTLSALEEAQGDTATAAVAMPLGEAASAQAAAIVQLREAAPDLPGARESETRSLVKLQEALSIAQQALEDAERREQDRKRQELQTAYRTALEAQVAITLETTELTDRQLSRRERAELRGLAGRETELAAQLEALREQFPELTETRVFDYTHRRMNDGLGRAAETLTGGEAGPAVAFDQASIERMLRGLIESLDSPQSDQEQDFSQGGGGGGGGGQGGGENPLIPPLAELQMLRTLQQDIYDRTRSLEQAGLSGEMVERVGSEQRELAEQARAVLEAMQQQAPGGGGG